MDFRKASYKMKNFLITGVVRNYAGTLINEIQYSKDVFVLAIHFSILMLLRALACNGYSYPFQDNAPLSQS